MCCGSNYSQGRVELTKLVPLPCVLQKVRCSVVSPIEVLVLFLMFPICTTVLMVWCRYMVEGVVMSSLQDVVDQIVVQLGKARDEIVAEIQALEDAAAAGETLDLSALSEAAQRLDDVVPDAVDEVGPVPGEELTPIPPVE